MSWKDKSKPFTPSEGGKYPSKDGPFSFTEQEDKWGYLNDPRWVAEHLHQEVNYTGREDEEPQVWTPRNGIHPPKSAHVHHPCGHWHKDKGLGSIYAANLYGLTQSGNPTVWGVHFDILTEKLSWGGYNATSGPDYNGLVICPYNGEDKLCVIDGIGASARLKFIELVPQDGVLKTVGYIEPPFNSYDVNNNFDTGLVYNSDENLLWSYILPENEFSCIVSMDAASNYARLARYMYGTVYQSDVDGNLYQYEYYYPAWGDPANYKPPSAPYWWIYWRLVDDNICDSPIETVYGGTPSVVYCDGSAIQLYYYGGHFYMTISHGPGGRLRKYTSNAVLVAEADSTGMNTIPFSLRPYDNKVLYCGGAVNGIVGVVNQSDLSLAYPTFGLEYGDVGTGDVEVCGDYLIAVTGSYGVNNGAIYILDKELNLQESYQLQASDGFTDFRRAAYISDDYVAVGSDQHIDVWRVPDCVLVDRLDWASQIPSGTVTQELVSYVFRR